MGDGLCLYIYNLSGSRRRLTYKLPIGIPQFIKFYITHPPTKRFLYAYYTTTTPTKENSPEHYIN